MGEQYLVEQHARLRVQLDADVALMKPVSGSLQIKMRANTEASTYIRSYNT